MPGIAIWVYLIAIAVPVFLLRHFHSQSWYWHVSAIAMALAIGFAPMPPQWIGPDFDLVLGCAFVVLLIWGMGGLIFWHPDDHKQWHRHA